MNLCGATNGIPETTLKKGDAGDCVKYLQWDLNQYFGLGKVTTNGKFTSATKGAVLNFQKKKNLVANGVVDYNTWVKLRAVECKVSQTVSVVNACTYVSVPVSGVSGVSGVSQ